MAPGDDNMPNHNEMCLKTSKKPDPNKISFVPGKGISLFPAFSLEIGHDVAAGDGLGLGPEKGHGLADAGLVVAQAAVPHLVRFPALKFVQPAVNLLEGFPEKGGGLPAMFFEGSHDGERIV
jgi:hypothetical protein